MLGLPDAISIEPTTSCNLRCPECPSGLRSFSRPTGMMSFKDYKKIIDEVADSVFYLTLYFQGEPFLNPHFHDMIAYAKEHSIYTSSSTNAHYLDRNSANETVQSGLDRLIVSMDGITQESYEQYRVGGSLEKVENGIVNLVNAKQKLGASTPFIDLQFIAFGHNEKEIGEVEKLKRRLGVDKVSIKTAQIYNHENGSPLIPENQNLSRYGKNGDGKWHIKSKLLDHCWKMWHSCVITWDGDIVPCCFDKDAKYSMGNVLDQGLEAIWYGKAYDDFRQKLLVSRGQIDICRNCTEGTKVGL